MLNGTSTRINCLYRVTRAGLDRENSNGGAGAWNAVPSSHFTSGKGVAQSHVGRNRQYTGADSTDKCGVDIFREIDGNQRTWSSWEDRNSVPYTLTWGKVGNDVFLFQTCLYVCSTVCLYVSCPSVFLSVGSIWFVFISFFKIFILYFSLHFNTIFTIHIYYKCWCTLCFSRSMYARSRFISFHLVTDFFPRLVIVNCSNNKEQVLSRSLIKRYLIYYKL